MTGCFGTEDGFFAGHSADEERAWKLLEGLRKEGVSWEEVDREFRKYLAGRCCPQKHVDKEMESVRRHMKSWFG